MPDSKDPKERLHPEDLPGVVRDEWLALVYWGGLSAYCTGYAIHEEHCVYLSLIGRVTAVKAVWAACMDRQVLQLPDETALRLLPVEEETTYQTLSVRLPDSDWGHTVMVHSQATQGNLADRVFYVLSGSPAPPLARFWGQWNRCLAYPSHPGWAAYLWQQGVRYRLIVACESRGTRAWAVRPEETWAEIITAGIQDSEIGM